MTPGTQQTNALLPDFCGVRMVFVVILIAELLALVLTLEETTEFSQAPANLALKSLFIQWMALASLAVLCVLRSRLNRLPDHWALGLAYLAILLVCMVITELTWWIVRQSPALGNLIESTHQYYLLHSMGISAIVAALSLRYFYVQHQWRTNLELQADARVQALQARIRPHFLFNCMNSIASLTRKDPKLAEETVEDLADLFRISLQDVRQLSTVKEELDLCKRYIRIESHRLGNRLTVNWQIEDLTPDLHIPPLTLQPLIENAIYHGIEHLDKGGVINIKGHTRGRGYTISIDNPLPDRFTLDHHDGNQLALENIRQRLQAFFGRQGKLDTRIIDNLYITEISIPWHAEITDR